MYSARQNTEAKAMFYFAADALRYDRKNAAQQKAILRKAFDNEGWEVPTLLDGLEDAPDFYFDSISQIRMDRFTNGRIALVGDAGYRASPLSGMGTSLALVGAYVLAGELAEAHDHRTASPEYERQLRAFALKCQQQAVDSEKWFVPRTRLGLRLRNFNYRMMSVLPTGKFVSKMALKVANAIPLKDYQEHLVVQP
jgi:2-polyprenyl-6-methoxyphenol hydroxylase-like FAD-dependent oxidoreductase